MKPETAAKYSHAPRSEAEISLRVNIEALRRRYRILFMLGLGVLLAMAAATVNAIHARDEATLKTKAVYQQVKHLLSAAYQADAPAHAQVMKRFEAITNGESLAQVETSTRVSIINGQKTVAPEIKFGEISRVQAVNDMQADESEKPALSLYSERSSGGIHLGDISHSSEVCSVNRDKEWSKITLSNGVPMWIAAEYAERIDDTLIRVKASRVGLRIKPDRAKQHIVTIVDTGDVLEVIKVGGWWYQVNSPVGYKAWVKTAQLERLMSATPRSTKGQVNLSPLQK